eukprot:6402796-Prorocentrum_lima.AAC.1
MVEGARAPRLRTSPFNYPWSRAREHHVRVQVLSDIHSRGCKSGERFRPPPFQWWRTCTPTQPTHT